MERSQEAETEVWQRYFENVPQLLHMDDQVVAFKDRDPKARVHVLVVPRHRHILGVEKLQPSDIPLLEAMARVGKQLTDCQPHHMGFHQPPFRSVPHLHLHCLVPPFSSVFVKPFFTTLLGRDSHFGYTTLSHVKGRLQRM